MSDIKKIKSEIMQMLEGLESEIISKDSDATDVSVYESKLVQEEPKEDDLDNKKDTGEDDEDTENCVKDRLSEEDIKALFGSEEISEEFVQRVQTIFEATVNSKVKKINERVEEELQVRLDEAVNSIEQELTNKIDEFIEELATQYIAENQVAIESSARVHLLESFVDGVRNVLVENDIDLPYEKVEVVEALTVSNQSLEDKNSRLVEENLLLQKEIVTARRGSIIKELGENLVLTEFEKFRDLVESVSYENEVEFKEKAEHILESYFNKESRKPAEQKKQELSESVEQEKLTPADLVKQKYLKTVQFRQDYK